MAEDLKEERVYRVFQTISGSYDRANDRISLGMQRHWKGMLIDRLSAGIPRGGSLLDVCCGTGDIAIRTARKRPDLKVTGLDFSPEMLRTARRKGRGRRNLRFVQGNAMHLPFSDHTFEAAAISFGLRNTADYRQVLCEMCRVVKPGGKVYCLDSFVPDCLAVRPFYQLYFRGLMPILGGGIKYRREYLWLYESTRRFLSRRELAALYSAIGLKEIGYKNRMCGACVLVWGRK